MAGTDLRVDLGAAFLRVLGAAEAGIPARWHFVRQVRLQSVMAAAKLPSTLSYVPAEPFRALLRVVGPADSMLQG